jgi:putative Ca2+/H+ antiporter (TMEM165/GDT1 family)
MLMKSIVFQTFVLVGAAELFDKTFFIAMLLAMKHKQMALIIFVGCYAALVVHTLMAAVLGYGISRMIATRTLDFAAAALYFAFAMMYANDFRSASGDSNGALEDAQEALDEEEVKGKSLPAATYGTVVGKTGELGDAMRRTAIPTLRILTLAFTSTFIGEFGDRTQFAMIGQHASQPLIPVCIGSVLAFFVVCGIAVGCGAFLSAVAVSERRVALVGGASFFAFALVSLHNAMEDSHHAPRDLVTGSFLQKALGAKE